MSRPLAAAWRRCALPNTTAALAALLLLPAIGLLIWPRPQAVGLGRVLAHAQLMQSFAPAPERPLPGLWQQRLGVAGPTLWARQAGVWWQFWGAHGDAGAYLVLPASALNAVNLSRLPQQPVLVDDLAVFAADPLSRQWLAERLRTSMRPSRGIEQRCLQQLRRPQTVVWNAGGLGVLAGPVAPLLQRLQQGCLSLQLRQGNLELTGEVAAGAGVVGDPAAATLPPLPQRPLPSGVLLELRGPSLEVLLQGLLARQLVREPLAERYGIAEPQLALLRRLPFVLRLREQPQGAFQASIELEVLPRPRDRRAWAELLRGLRQPLQQQGLQDPEPRLLSTGPKLASGLLPATSWRNADGAIVGGWFWRTAAAGSAASSLVLYLGPTPESTVMGPGPEGLASLPLQLRSRPAELQRLGLFPSAFPELVRQARTLELQASDGAQQPVSQLKGRLEPSRSR